ncbi:MAG: choice-of-anchor D domain-containing protein, partial [Acidobacteria bacterium]|nr:choice-of-anchor D domain-containing protein [Acidobacteriota bacterium]
TFSGTVVGSTSSPPSVPLTNNGTSSLTITGIAATSQYAETNTCGTLPASLASKASCVISVTFTPAAAGTQEGAVMITDSASGGTQTVELSGTGTSPTLTLTPSSLTFGSQVVGITATAESVTVTNTGTASLSFSSITATGDFAVDAAGTTCSTSATLAASAHCTVSLTFTPTATGTRTGSLNIASTGDSGTVALTGTGTAPGVTLTPSSLTFSGTVVGSTSPAQPVTLTNKGTSSLTITGITVNDEFAVASAGTTCSAGKTLAASTSCTIAVTFTPSAGGTRTGAVMISDNSGSSPQTVALSGEGEDFSLAASTTSQTVLPGAAATYDLQLAPEGGFNQAINLSCSGAPAYATCTVTPASVTLDGTDDAAVQLKVATSGNAMVGPGPGNFAPPPSGSLPVVAWLAILGLLGLVALVKFSPEGGRVRRAAPWATLALLAALCAGCGGGSSGMGVSGDNSTPAGTYVLTVKATSGSLSQTTQVTLKVE